MKKNIKISILLIVLFMTLVLFMFVNKITTPRYLSESELLVNGFYQFSEPKEFSDFKIMTSEDVVLSKQDLIGKWTLIYFGYTRCPAECPVAMSLIKGLYSTLNSKGLDMKNKQMLLVTIDPENDSAEQVDSYAKAFNKTFIGARGARPALLSIATQFNVMVVEPPKINTLNNMVHLENHSNNILLINPDSKYAGFFRPPFDAEKFLLIYQSLVAER